MKALCIGRRPDVGQLVEELVMRDLPLPEPGRGQVRAQVKASTGPLGGVLHHQGELRAPDA